uniref:Uncharacterized protein n=1 Tax=Utricularia reniformis TaxID=192314 RepID=A0A1Y0B042_9LAMI|nr:hypothetical protein AEK19_MT0507 [Utricularia reniformis]ART30763.1 hypothetical protein AEK19_MT0507 [Utricularia reniformis]
MMEFCTRSLSKDLILSALPRPCYVEIHEGCCGDETGKDS